MPVLALTSPTYNIPTKLLLNFLSLVDQRHSREREALRAASLVARSWTGAAQAILWRTVRLQKEASAIGFTLAPAG